MFVCVYTTIDTLRKELKQEQGPSFNYRGGEVDDSSGSPPPAASEQRSVGEERVIPNVSYVDLDFFEVKEKTRIRNRKNVDRWRRQTVRHAHERASRDMPPPPQQGGSGGVGGDGTNVDDKENWVWLTSYSRIPV